MTYESERIDAYETLVRMEQDEANNYPPVIGGHVYQSWLFWGLAAWVFVLSVAVVVKAVA